MAADSRTGGGVRTSVWLADRPAPKRRAQQPTGLDRDRITEVTVRLLDSEGLAKFSMRRLAAELGVTAMSVYWYVDTKDDLLELALDAVFGELELPDEETGDWAGQLRQLATGYRKLLTVHPWMSPLVGQYLNVGPHARAFSSVAQRVIRRSGLPPQQVTGALSAVFQFVYGFGTIEARFKDICRGAGLSQDEYFREMMSAVEAGEDSAEFEESRRTMEARGGGTVDEMRNRDFDHALAIVVAGIEALRGRA